jgi:uncharacterized protein (DUF1697 family)
VYRAYDPLVRQIVLLRGINVGRRNRIAMPALRELFLTAGFADVQTYLQSGNIVLSSDLTEEQLAATSSRLIRDAFAFEIASVARTRDELAAVVALNPLGGIAVDPKRYLVTFFSEEPEVRGVERVRALAREPEELFAAGRELYGWHPAGIARSKLWNAIAAGGLGGTSTSRNWATVTALHGLLDL